MRGLEIIGRKKTDEDTPVTSCKNLRCKWTVVRHEHEDTERIN